MREIKFRAWEIEKQRMIQPNELSFHEYITVEEHFQDDTYIFMQFTGLLDKDGKEIFEGDIFNYKTDKRAEGGGYVCGTYGYHPENARVVEYDNGMFYVEHQTLCEFVSFSKLPGHGKEIIGNIYENPELLQENS